MKPTDLFQSVDLFENQNMDAVIKGIVALGRTVGNLVDLHALPSTFVHFWFASFDIHLSEVSDQ